MRVGRKGLGRLLVTMLLAGIGVTATTTVAAQPAMAIGGSFHWIKNSGNGLCLQPEGNSTATGARIIQWPCATSGVEGLAQGWAYTKIATNHYKFMNQYSGLCIDAFDDVNGAGVVQWPCNGNSNQEFNTGKTLPAVTKIELRTSFRDTATASTYRATGVRRGWQCRLGSATARRHRSG